MTIADWAPLVFGVAGLLALFLFFSLAEHERTPARKHRIPPGYRGRASGLATGPLQSSDDIPSDLHLTASWVAKLTDPPTGSFSLDPI